MRSVKVLVAVATVLAAAGLTPGGPSPASGGPGDGCAPERALVALEVTSRGGAARFQISPELVPDEGVRRAFERQLERFFDGADVAAAADFFRAHPEESLRVFDHVRRVLGSDWLASLLYRTLETERIPLREAMWELTLENRYFELRMLYRWFVERSHPGILPLLHFVMSSPGMAVEDRLVAAAFLHRLGDPGGQRFVRAVYASKTCAEHRSFIEWELGSLL